ncbi:MAG: YicC/YloC family endoribonuclease [Lysobacterales bacterium]|jgi:uncharacterized protein (TIGR00255 family)
MIRSMTGFAGAERQFDFGRLAWEVRSVNHRYLEVGFRVPEEFRVLEPDIRRILGEHLARGKVDAALRFTPSAGARGAQLNLNRALVERLLSLHSDVGEMAGFEREPDLLGLLRWPGAVEEQAPDPAPLHEAALELLGEAAAGLREARGREGAQMDAAIRERLQTVETWVNEIRGWLPEIRDGLRQKIMTRIGELQQPLEPGRLEQEVAFLAQKMDVDEELDRLDAHVAEARLILERDDPVGRRLDFLMQEFNRESNTLSSKSVDQRTTQAAVELKVAIEQMREQVQNIE